MPAFVCPRCRGASLTSQLRCGACGAGFGTLTVGDSAPPVALLLDDDDAEAGSLAAERILDELERGACFDQASLPPSDEPFLSAMSVYGNAHWGEPSPAKWPRADVGWLTQWLRDADLPPGPVLLLGAACGGETRYVPKEHAVVVLDGSVPLLAIGARLAVRDVWLPQARTPGRYGASLVSLSPEVRARLQDVVWLAADARAPPLPPRSFSAVVALNVLDSVTHPERVLRAAAELVAPGGSLICSSPFNWSDEVTAPSRRLDAADIVRISADLRLRRHASDIPWGVQVHDRLRLTYALEAFWLQRDGPASQGPESDRARARK